MTAIEFLKTKDPSFSLLTATNQSHSLMGWIKIMEEYAQNQVKNFDLADVVKPKGTLPCIQQCSVCKTTMVNWVGSTPCCGGMAEYLYEDEVEALGFVVDLTRNKGTIRPAKG